MRRGWMLVCASGLVGCSGGAPLLHPAHVLHPGHAAVGAGVSGRLAAASDVSAGADSALSEEAVAANGARVEDVVLAPGIAPYVAGRVGIDGDNEAGITYTARAFRLDIRHAFQFGPLFLSTGIGGSAVFPRVRKEGGQEVGTATGGGGDIPILLGVRSASDLYAVWIGPRGGVELLRGELRDDAVIVPDAPTGDFADFEATHGYIGGLVGMRVGFRHFHVALEAAAAYHRVDGSVGSTEASVDFLELTPAGALIISF